MKKNLIGQSTSFLSVLDKVSKLAPIERPVLIVGERGTGKELIAQRLHYLSKRWDQPIISVNCATLSDGVIDSELFGHESGAFTGSKGRHIGRFERAENGTLFLDELATAPLAVQEKLLRVIEYGQYERVGGSSTLTANVRLICATNADLPQLAAQDKFRADLLDRIAFDVIHLPPLRERQEDILLLADYYGMKMCQELSLPLFLGFTQEIEQQLQNYRWPGNVRELKNVVERAIYQHYSNDQPIDQIQFDPFDAPWLSTSSTNTASPTSSEHDIERLTHHTSTTRANALIDDQLPIDYKQWLEQCDIQWLNQAMSEAKYNQRNAAKLLGLSYHQLRGMLRKYQIGNDSE
jgi:psp operon transcriptional activator